MHEDNIELVAEWGITEGCGAAEDRTFCPDKTITRAQMAAFLVRAIDPDPLIPEIVFTDVPPDAWYSSYVNQMAAMGVMEGYPDGSFRPDEIVSRADMAWFLTRAFVGITAIESPVGLFVDVPMSSPYAPAVEGVFGAGITVGCTATPLSYCPDEPVTRAQMATFFVRALQ